MTYKNFLHEYRPGIEYHANLRNINNAEVSSVFNKYSKYGYIIISPSACTAEFGLDLMDSEYSSKRNEINAARIREMIGILKKNRYSYMPVYARFVEKADIFHEEHTYERAVIIFNYHTGRNVKLGCDINQPGDAESLKGLVELGQELAEQFNQKCFLYQEPGQPMQYVYRNGNICDAFVGDETNFNELTQRYWVELRDRLTGGGTLTRGFSRLSPRNICRLFEIEQKYAGCYVNPAPSGVSQRRGRSANKEIFPRF